jgi:tellurite resistance protein TerC
VVDFTDLVFAVDSIPAVLSISSDPFIVYTSNVFAILGLRALFFALSGMMDLFKYLKYGLAVILTFVGVKMIISHYVHIPVEWALFVVVIILAISIMLSLARKNRAA